MTDKSPDELPGESDPAPSGESATTKGRSNTLPVTVTEEEPWRDDDDANSQIVMDALGERYEIASVLGKGSFGSVYKVRDAALNRTVAVKNVRLDTADPELQDDIKKRFLREARVAALLRHPNIVTIHDIISTPHASLILMEFVEGISLQTMLAAKKRLGLGETINILKQVASALDHAHEHKVIHRDVKPANIMVTSTNEVRVTDFGIAKTETSSDITMSGTILGTPDYMSPEQAKGDPIDGRSDLFSLGCVLHECLAGEKPFKSESITGVLLRIISEDPPPPVHWKKMGLPGELEQVMNTVLAKIPDDRYPTGAALIEALERLLPDEDEEILVEINLTHELESAEPQTAEDDETVSPPRGNQGSSRAEISCLESLKEVDRPLSMTTNNPNVVHDLDLDTDEAFIISRIDGQAKARDILAVSPLPEKETARSLLALIEMGLVKFHDPAEAPPGADIQEKKEEQKSQTSDDRCDELLENEVERFSRVVEDGATPPQLNREQSESLYLRAEKSYATRDFWETIQLCRYAAAASPRDSRFHYLLGLALSENVHWRQEAEGSLKAALELDSQNPEYIYALADFYQKLGRSKEAKEMYNRAKSVNKPESSPG